MRIHAKNFLNNNKPGLGIARRVSPISIQRMTVRRGKFDILSHDIALPVFILTKLLFGSFTGLERDRQTIR
jgi:hypothetical protein